MNCGSSQFKAVEAVDLADADARLHGGHVAGDQLENLGESEAVGFGEIRRGFDVIHPLPAVHDRELRALGVEDGRDRSGLHRAPGGAVFMREVEAKFVLIVLNRLQGRKFNCRVTREAARIENPCVIAGLAVDDLLGQQAAMAAPLAQPCAQTLPGMGPTSGAPSMV